ncbi:hypothetical protein JAU75_19180 [Ochrobactrum sp. Q0168]|uniref:hypothetical protein n=1 Tax=Ochrobactrum sp. Q0168 TaxID=2793241 RepID=UPI0018EBC6D2|nr:hypothetical protein [Ochrobactrum sp. Q0168]
MDAGTIRVRDLNESRHQMFQQIIDWLLNIVISTGAIGFIAFIMRDTISQLFTRSVANHYEKELETFRAEIREKEEIFRTELRGSEKELDEIRSYLISANKERNTLIQAKRLDAAESLLKARQSLSQFSMLVEYINILNIDHILENGNNPKIIEFIKTLLNPFDIDNKIQTLSATDKTLFNLYLSDQTLKLYSAYESLIYSAVILMKFMTVPLEDKSDIIDAVGLRKKIIEIAPTSKEGFDKFGERYAFHWSGYVHDQILISTRRDIFGDDSSLVEMKSMERVAVQSREAQNNIREILRRSGLSDALLEPPDKTNAT